MKIKLSKRQIESIVSDPDKAHEIGVRINDPWCVIMLKVLAYIIGLLLGGAVTTSCVSTIL